MGTDGASPSFTLDKYGGPTHTQEPSTFAETSFCINPNEITPPPPPTLRRESGATNKGQENLPTYPSVLFPSLGWTVIINSDTNMLCDPLTFYFKWYTIDVHTKCPIKTYYWSTSLNSSAPNGRRLSRQFYVCKMFTKQPTHTSSPT